MARLPKVVLGLSYGHGDSSAALVVDGHLVAAVEEERFNRIKHYALFPEAAIHYCLGRAGIAPAQVDVIAIAKRPWNQIWKKMSLALAHPDLLFKSGGRPKTEIPLKKTLAALGLGHCRIKTVEHHHAHMISAGFLSPSHQTAFLSFDGLGDFVSAATGVQKQKQIAILDRVTYPHSLGFFYTAMTQYLGFPYFGDEFKVMGLSSLGKPKYLSVMKNLIREVSPFGFRLNLEAFPILRTPQAFYIENGQPYVGQLYNRQFLTSVLGINPRKPTDPLLEVHWDLAKSVQARFEEVANHLVHCLEKKVDSDTLALSGGCAHNSVWVGKIPSNSRFKNIIVAPASHDAGIAVGAAVHAARVPVVMAEQEHWALLGPEPEQNKTSYSTEGLFEKSFKKEAKLIEFMVDQLAKGKIIGLARGRLEFGPRALGSRSILCDPRAKEMKEKLNSRVKHRESFRPFAASVLEEYQDDWFVDPFYAPTMEAVFQVKDAKQKKIPAVVHADGSCRIQSIRKKNQPFYWELIEAFRKKTGVPMLVNTSFNDSEPIVLSENDAIQCFKNTDMDFLVLGNRVFSKDAAEIALAG